ncbi:hypothetical protein PTKIN_Ptkin13bG0122900 [Pterospermum kingtungense]
MVRRKMDASRVSVMKRQKLCFKQNFRSQEDQERYEKEFVNRKVKAGRVIDWDFLTEIGFPYLDIFEEFGWKIYLTSKGEVFENLVKVFYSNARKIAKPGCDFEFYTGRFSTYLIGKDYEISEGIIAKALAFGDMEGEKEPSLKNSKVSLAKKVLGKICSKNELDSTGIFGMHDRLLHLIVTYIFEPSGTAYSRIQRRDLWWMYMIKNRKKPNVPTMILRDMMRIVEKPNNAILLYGMVLSLVFAQLKVNTKCDVVAFHKS